MPRLLLPRFCPAFLLLLGLALPSAAQKPNFATVDISRAFEAYHITVAEREKIRQARAELKRDPRLEKIKLLEVELLDLRDRVRDTTLTDSERQNHFRKFQIKAQDLRALQRATIEHLDEQARIIDEGMVKKTRHLLGEIRAAVQKLALEGGYDYVFESSGKTSSQIQSLIYIRHATDLTDLVIEALNGGEADKDIATVEKPR